MFEKDVNCDKIETLIGEKAFIKGNLKGEGTLKIDGSIDGNVDWLENVIVGITSKIKGNITCLNAIVKGYVDGNISCENSLTLESCGRIKGDITVKNVIIAEGGYLEGKCNMVSAKPSKNIAE